MNRYPTILLIEDDEDDQLFFTEALSEIDSQAKLVIAKNGRHALDILTSLQAKLPDIIFLDLNTPVMDGFQFLTELRKLDNYKNIPAIVFSTTPYKIEETYPLGVIAGIEKASTTAGLRAILEILLS